MTNTPTGETFEQRKARIALLRRINAVLPKEKRHPIPPLHEPASPDPGQTTAPAVESLLAMPRRDYAEMVCDNLSADQDDTWTLYLDPRLIQLTHSVLVRKRAALARLTRDTRESASSRVGRRRWAFIDMLESRIQQVEAALPDAVLTSDRDTAHRLFAAVQAHRRALTTSGVQPEVWDLKLWQVVDHLTAETPHEEWPGEPEPPTPVP
ncbi:MAG: hypothetical protein HOV92_12560 [Streptomyces sp.]|nr:hypothetical protein [Streptomyces sp.]